MKMSVSIYADPARAKTTPSDAESTTKKADSNREPNIKETDVRVESTSAAAAAAADTGREEKQEQMLEVKSSTLQGQHKLKRR